MPRLRSHVVPVVGLVAFLATPVLAAESEPQRPNFSGRWKLDAAKSDDARAQLRQAMAGGPRGMGGGRRPGGIGGDMGGGRRGNPGGGMGGDRGPGGRGAGGRGEGDRGEEARILFEGLELLAIAQSDAAFDITYASGRQRTLRFDAKDDSSGEEEKTKSKRETKARWEGSKLVVETKSDEGRNNRETWEMGPDGKVFTLTTKLQGGRLNEPVVIFRVYQSVPAAETASPSPTPATATAPTTP